MEPLIKDPPRRGRPPYKGHVPFPIYFLTSEKRTTSVSPKCPLFGGSTVQHSLSYVTGNGYSLPKTPQSRTVCLPSGSCTGERGILSRPLGGTLCWRGSGPCCMASTTPAYTCTTRVPYLRVTPAKLFTLLVDKGLGALKHLHHITVFRVINL